MAKASEQFLRKPWTALLTVFVLPVSAGLLCAGCGSRRGDSITTSEVVHNNVTYELPHNGLPSVADRNGVTSITVGGDVIRNDNGQLSVNGTPYGKIRAGDIVEWHANKSISVNQVPRSPTPSR